MVTRWPDVDHPRTPSGWSWPPNLLAAQGPSSWPRGRRPAGEAEEILSEAVAWWDVERSGFRDGDRWLRNLGSAGGVLDLRLGSSLLANSNDPKYLGVEQSGYVYVPAVASNFLSVPHVAGTQTGATIDARVDVAADVWDPGATQFLMGKSSATGSVGGVGFAWSTSTSSRLVFTWSDASTVRAGQSAIVLNAAPFTTATRLRLRVTYERDTGAGQYAVNFFYNDADFTTALDALSSWTQIGSTSTGASTGAMSDPAADVLVAARRTASDVPFGGRYYGASLAVGGSTVFLVDCDAITSGSATSFTATTGQQVSINRATSGRKSVAMPARRNGGACFLLGTDDYLECVDSQQHGALNFSNADSFTILVTGRQWATPPNGRPFISKANYSTNDGWRLANNGTAFQARIFGKQGNLDASSPTFTAGTNVLMMGVTNRVTRRVAAWANGTSGTPSVLDPTLTDLRVPSLTRIGSNSDGSVFYQDFEFRAAAVWRRPLTSREITVLANSGIWGT